MAARRRLLDREPWTSGAGSGPQDLEAARQSAGELAFDAGDQPALNTSAGERQEASALRQGRCRRRGGG